MRGLDPKLEVRTGEIAFHEVRAGKCDDGGGVLIDQVATMAADEDPSGNTAKGPCCVVGNSATIATTIRLASVKDDATAAGLAARLGATEARVEGFTLRDDTAAARRALDAAIRNARDQAGALAAASGVRLGGVLSIANVEATELMAALDMSYNKPLPAVASPPPIAVDIAPTPVETSARFIVTFALLP